MVNDHLTLWAEPEDKGTVVIVTPDYHALQPNWSLLLLVNLKDSLHCKQGMLLVNM